MYTYVLRRLASSILIVVGLLTVLFFVLHLSPGDPFARFESSDIDPDFIEAMRKKYGLDQPLPVQYLHWAKAFLLDWDFGVSLTYNRPVRDLIAQTLPNTMRLAFLAFLLRMGLGVALGIISAVRKGSWTDRSITFLSLIIYSMPTFWLGLMLLMVFAFQLQWLPAGQMHSLDSSHWSGWSRFWDGVAHILLPAFVLGVGGAASTARYMRASLLEVLSKDFVRTARAKGLSERVVVLKHALRNSLLPIATLVGLSIPSLVGGSLIVEFIFSWPGMGRLTVEALAQRDYPVILATTYLSAVLVVGGNLLSDLLYTMLDPRIRLGGRS